MRRCSGMRGKIPYPSTCKARCVSLAARTTACTCCWPVRGLCGATVRRGVLEMHSIRQIGGSAKNSTAYVRCGTGSGSGRAAEKSGTRLGGSSSSSPVTSRWTASCGWAVGCLNTRQVCAARTGRTSGSTSSTWCLTRLRSPTRRSRRAGRGSKPNFRPCRATQCRRSVYVSSLTQSSGVYFVEHVQCAGQEHLETLLEHALACDGEGYVAVLTTQSHASAPCIAV